MIATSYTHVGCVNKTLLFIAIASKCACQRFRKSPVSSFAPPYPTFHVNVSAFVVPPQNRNNVVLDAMVVG